MAGEQREEKRTLEAGRVEAGVGILRRALEAHGRHPLRPVRLGAMIGCTPGDVHWIHYYLWALALGVGYLAFGRQTVCCAWPSHPSIRRFALVAQAFIFAMDGRCTRINQTKVHERAGGIMDVRAAARRWAEHTNTEHNNHNSPVMPSSNQP